MENFPSHFSSLAPCVLGNKKGKSNLITSFEQRKPCFSTQIFSFLVFLNTVQISFPALWPLGLPSPLFLWALLRLFAFLAVLNSPLCFPSPTSPDAGPFPACLCVFTPGESFQGLLRVYAVMARAKPFIYFLDPAGVSWLVLCVRSELIGLINLTNFSEVVRLS